MMIKRMTMDSLAIRLVHFHPSTVLFALLLSACFRLELSCICGAREGILNKRMSTQSDYSFSNPLSITKLKPRRLPSPDFQN